MLKKQYRLPANTRLHHPSLARSPFFFLKIAKNDLSYNRFGFVVKKSIDKRATRRNRLKRLLRSCIEELFGQIHSGYDMLFFLEKGIIGKRRDEIYQELRQILTEQRLIWNKFYWPFLVFIKQLFLQSRASFWERISAAIPFHAQRMRGKQSRKKEWSREDKSLWQD